MALRFAFRPRQRLRRQRDFDRVFARRCTEGDRFLVVYVDIGELEWSRLGIKVGRRVGGAVARARARRRLREAFRLRQHDLPAGLDVVCVARGPKTADAGVEELGRSLERLIQRAAARLARTRPGS
ncbi:MAG TPA: ribonuclease P protein component [Phycisphaerae bacterium]|nr:ribonuclease P protein component [Phycisphaerae bacterium]